MADLSLLSQVVSLRRSRNPRKELNMDRTSSLVLGIAVVVAALINAYAPSASGRYQMAANPGHAYVLDTATGQVWQTFYPENQGSYDRDFFDPK